MTIYAIMLNIRNPLTKKEEVQGAIKGLSGNWAVPFDGVWLVYGTSLDANTIYSRLKALLHIEPKDGSPADLIFVAEIGRDRIGWLQKKVWEWMKSGEDGT